MERSQLNWNVQTPRTSLDTIRHADKIAHPFL